MLRGTDPENFFQTDASELTRARRAAKSGNKHGDPLTLKSKLLSVIPDPASSSCVYVAESAGCVRRVNVDTGDSQTVYRGPAAPVTSVAIGGEGEKLVFGGCWDKDIWSWDRDSRSVVRRYKGHSDFVKTIICARLAGKNVLISGGADSKIIVWDIETGAKIHTLRDKSDTMMAVQCLAIDPLLSNNDTIILVTSSSDPHIRLWTITADSWVQTLHTKDEKKGDTILEHETSIYALLFDPTLPMEDWEHEDLNLWTASADGSVKCLSRSRDWVTEDEFVHGDYVRAVALTEQWVITAGRDEDVKVWDRGTGKLEVILEGHFEEVTGLVARGNAVVSVSIDGTVRKWALDKASLNKVRVEREETEKGVVKEEVPVVKEGLMTAEEEAELAELMDSD